MFFFYHILFFILLHFFISPLNFFFQENPFLNILTDFFDNLHVSNSLNCSHQCGFLINRFLLILTKTILFLLLQYPADDIFICQ